MIGRTRFCCRTECLGLRLAARLPLEGAYVYAVSAGGVQVADPIAFFQGRPIVWIEDVDAVRAVAGEPAYLVDDGFAAPARLAAAARSLRAGEPTLIRLVIPWLRAASRRQLAASFEEIHLDMTGVPRLPPYVDPPDEEAARTFVRWSRRYTALAPEELG